MFKKTILLWINIQKLILLAVVITPYLTPLLIMSQTVPIDGRGGGILTFNSDRDGNNEVYIMNADGSGQRNITNNAANDGFGVWSPDGKKIAFVSDRDGDFGVYVMNVTTLAAGEFDTPVKIADKRPSSRVSWSPDGSKIIFDAWPECELYIVDTDGNNLTKLTNTPDCECQPHFSPDGSKVAYSLIVNDQQDVYVMNFDGTNKTQITGDGGSFFPTWSPDGNDIAIMSSRSGRLDVDICLIDPDGSNRRWLTDYSNHDEFPSWSPDGSRIVYHSQRGVSKIYIMNSDGSNNNLITSNTSYNNGEPYWRPVMLPPQSTEILAYVVQDHLPPDEISEIYLINADGSGKTQLTNQPDRRPYAPAFSPDGSRIVHYTHVNNTTWSLWIMNSDGSNIQRLTSASNTLDWMPGWSPDGSTIIFTRSYMIPTWRSEIWKIKPDGTNPVRIGTMDGEGSNYSPDGSKIAFSTYFEGGGDIWIMHADGTDAIQLTTNPSEDWHPRFSPDGSKIAFQSMRDGNFEIYVMNSDGSNQVRLTNNSAEDGNVDWSADGSRIAFVSERDGHSEIYIMNADGTNQTRLTYTSGRAINPDWKSITIPDTTLCGDSISVDLKSGWNMISLPIDSNYLPGDLDPLPVSEAFYYDPDSSKYVAESALNYGKGYWLKFSTDGVMKFFMDSTFADTINVEEGWNMIGSVSLPVPVEAIISYPPGMVTSEFFTYLSGYIESNTIIPGTGYWVKVEQPGQLILSASGHISPLQYIRIVQDDETPPLPPFELMSEDEKSVPSRFVLHQNYPNPFNPTTTIKFEIPTNCFLKLEVYNVLGMLVKTLVNEIKRPGIHSVIWDGSDNLNKQVSSGLYLYKLTIGAYCRTQKTLIIR